MAFRKSIINPVTQEKETGTVLEVVKANEPMMQLELEDGTRIRIKHSFLEVIRMDKKDENGRDIYNFEGNMAINITSGEEQKDV